MPMADTRMDSGTESTISVGRRVTILSILALVQFTSIVDFMVVMPLGPAVDPRSWGSARVSSA